MLGAFNPYNLKRNIVAWLEEDMPFGDLTTQNLKNCKNGITATLIAKEKGIICGLDILKLVFETVDSSIILNTMLKDGDALEEHSVIGTLSGPLTSILMGERLALNLLQRLSGIATLSHTYANEVRSYHTKIVDTRKTTPGLRELEKYAVRIGGCSNHRYSLSDSVMIKDNHIKAVGSMETAITQIKAAISHTTKIEIEVENIDSFIQALKLDVDIIMLDNMSDELMAKAVAMNEGKVILEASGNISLDRLAGIAKIGIDIISVGALTHSAPSLDISLKFI